MFTLFLQSGLLSPRKFYCKVMFSVLLTYLIIHEKEIRILESHEIKRLVETFDFYHHTLPQGEVLANNIFMVLSESISVFL